MLAVHSLRNNHPLIRRKALAWSLGIGTLRVGIEVVARQELSQIFCLNPSNKLVFLSSINDIPEDCTKQVAVAGSWAQRSYQVIYLYGTRDVDSTFT